ncbi:hypothetical protein GF319_00850 [Candidatus Bathyarchaeota archaeon]|nr:hypothetical protein [Candidatus Bathyarchaeota archaeon]
MKKVLAVSLTILLLGSLFIAQAYAQDFMEDDYAVGGEILPLFANNLLLSPISLLLIVAVIAGLAVLVSGRPLIETPVR